MILSKLLGIVVATVALTTTSTPVPPAARASGAPNASKSVLASSKKAKATAREGEPSGGFDVKAKEAASAHGALPQENDVCATQEVDHATLLKTLGEMVGDQKDVWLEYAPVKQGKLDTGGLIRFSFIEDKETGNIITEIWLDKFGSVAVRSRIGPDGKVINELKHDDTVYLIPEQKRESLEGLSDEEKAKKMAIQQGVCDLKKLLQEKIQQSIEVNQTPQKIQTLAGTFHCAFAALKAPGNMVMGVHVCDDAPVMKVARFIMPNGSALELVASGKGAYSSFPVGVEAVSMDAMIGMLEGIKRDIDEENLKAQIRQKADDAALSETKAPATTSQTADTAKKLPEGMLYEEDPESRKGMTIDVHPVGPQSGGVK